MAHLYAVTSHKATAVTYSITCNFTGPQDRNLIVARTNTLYVYSLKEGGLALESELTLFGRIKGLESYRPLTYDKDTLFVMTERRQICLLEYDAQAKKVITQANLDVQDRIGKEADLGPRCLADPESRMMALMLYNGSMKIVPLEGLSFKEPFNVTIEESRVIDIKFLHGSLRPTMCMLYEDNQRARHVKTASIDLRDRELVTGVWSQSNVDYTASFLIPVPAPLNGVIVVGMMSITYLSGSGTSQTVEISPAQICSYCALNSTGSRFLLCDHRGQLTVLALVIENGKVTSIYTDVVGTTSIAETMNYIDHGLVFIGSCLGDSQLIKLHDTKDPLHGNVEILDVYKNIGPILDMCLVENDRGGGQRQLVTCSGAYKDGSLRVIRNGIGIRQQAALEVPGIKSVWSLRATEESEYDKYLVQSFITETRILAMEEEELGEFDFPGFDTQSPSVYCCNMAGKLIVQVTPQSVRLIDAVSLSLLDEHRTNKTLTVAKSNLIQLVVSLSGGTLLYFEIDSASKKLVLISEKQLDQDVACLSMKVKSESRDSDKMEVDTEEKETVIAVGMWTDNTVRLLTLPSFDEVNRTVLGTETQARDILLAAFDSLAYLFVGMGDGHLITYIVDFNTGGLPTLSNKRNGVVGTQPLAFSTFINKDELCIFACCDRPTIIYMRNKKILFSLVDNKNSTVTAMSSFHTDPFPDSIALCSETELVIGTVEDIQKLHVQTIAINEAPRRIAHCQGQRAYAVCTEQVIQGEHGDESVCRILFFEDSDMSLITVYKLDMLEQGLTVISCKFNDQDKSYFVVGTAQIVNEEPEPSKGRLLIFEVSEDRKNVILIAEKEAKSGVYSLASVCGKVAAGIGSKVQIYKLVIKDQGLSSNFGIKPELQSECSHQGHVLVLYLKSSGDYVLAGDLLRSMTLLQYKPTANVLDESARDYSVHVLRAVEFMDGFEDFYLGCEDFANLFTVRKRIEAVSDEERSRLESCGYFHLGDHVNALKRGTLVSHPIDNEAMQTTNPAHCNIFDANYRNITGYTSDLQHSVLYGSISGAIGNIIALTESSFHFFNAVEKAMKNVINPIGGFSHGDWRSFKSEVKLVPQKGILDGDLIEMLLDLNREELDLVTKQVNNILYTTTGGSAEASGTSSADTAALMARLAAQRAPFSPEEIVQRVEDISRLH